MSKKYVYLFGGGNGAEGNKDMKDTLGGKGANLAEMSKRRRAGSSGLHRSSPRSATSTSTTTSRCRREVDDQIRQALAKVEKQNSARSSATLRNRCCSACAPARSSRCRA